MTNGNGGNGAGSGIVLASSPGGDARTGYNPGPPRNLGDPESEGLTLHGYLNVLWRRKWVVLLIVAITTTSAFFFANRQPRQYSATATIIYDVMGVSSGAATTSGYYSVYDRDVMMNAVNDLLQSPELVELTGDILKEKGYDVSSFSVSAARRGGSSGSVSTESIVTVTAGGTDPELAAATANAAAEAFVEWGTSRVRRQLERSILLIRERLSSFDEKTKGTEDYALLKQRIEDLRVLRDTASGGFRVLLPAKVPTVPYAPNPPRSAAVGFLVGVVAALCLAFLLELFDTRIRRPDDVARILRQPILGRIPRISSRLLGDSSLVTMKHPEGHIAESFRMVRTNLEFMAVDYDIRSFLVTSCMKGEGKSVAVANLAISLALAGKRIVVIDADLRRPRQHKLFGLDNEEGVSTVATGRTTLAQAMVSVNVTPTQDDDGAAKAAAEGADVDFEDWAGGPDSVARLYVLPSGPIPPNPGEIVSSKRFTAIVEALEAQADIVIVDTPAMLAVGDTSAIAARVDGIVFLVDLKRIRRPQLITALEQLQRLPSRMIGAVVRMDASRGSHYYYSPYYYYRYSYTEDGQKSRVRKRSGGRSGGSKPAAAAVVAVAAADVAVPEYVPAGATAEMTSSAAAGSPVVRPLGAPPAAGGARPASETRPETDEAGAEAGPASLADLDDVEFFEPPERTAGPEAGATEAPSDDAAPSDATSADAPAPDDAAEVGTEADAPPAETPREPSVEGWPGAGASPESDSSD